MLEGCIAIPFECHPNTALIHCLTLWCTKTEKRKCALKVFVGGRDYSIALQ